MLKIVARFLVASAFFVAPVLTSAQDLQTTSAYVETLKQSALLDSLEDLANTLITDGSTQVQPDFDTTQALALDIEELSESPLVDSAETIADAATQTDEPVQVAVETTDLASISEMILRLENMNGKEVIDLYGDFMGTITAVNDEAMFAEVELVGGGTIAVMAENLKDMGNGFVATNSIREVITAPDPSSANVNVTVTEAR